MHPIIFSDGLWEFERVAKSALLIRSNTTYYRGSSIIKVQKFSSDNYYYSWNILIIPCTTLGTTSLIGKSALQLPTYFFRFPYILALLAHKFCLGYIAAAFFAFWGALQKTYSEEMSALLPTAAGWLVDWENQVRPIFYRLYSTYLILN